MLSSWYVSIHNISYANNQTITIPVCEEDYKITTKQYMNNNGLKPNQQSQTHYEFAIVGPYIILDHVLCYFYGDREKYSFIYTIRMFGWLNCTNTIKKIIEEYKKEKYDYDLYSIIINEVMTCSIKHKNKELFYWILNYMSDEEVKLFCNKNIPISYIDMKNIKINIMKKSELKEYIEKIFNLNETSMLSLLIPKS